MHNDKINKLRALACEVQDYQLERGLSDAKLYQKVGQIGSTKTYKRLLDEDDTLEQLDAEKQLANYEAAVTHIGILRQADRPAELEYDDFSNVTDSMSAIARALGEESIARFVVIEGENGTGKDAVKNAVLKRWGKITIPVEGTDSWKESPTSLLGDILNALSLRRRKDEAGEPFKLPMWPTARREIIVQELNKRKMILLINEGHHCGERGLTEIKTIINQTPAVIVMECIPTLLRRLMKHSYEEAKQLFGNRLCERVRLMSPPQDEILLMFERRKVRFANTEDRTNAALNLETVSPGFGNWRFVSKVCRECRDLHGDKGITLAQFSGAVSKVQLRCVGQ